MTVEQCGKCPCCSKDDRVEACLTRKTWKCTTCNGVHMRDVKPKKCNLIIVVQPCPGEEFKEGVIHTHGLCYCGRCGIYFPIPSMKV